MANWYDLPLDILSVIAQLINVMEDFASFSAVCKKCRFVTTMLKKKASLPPRYPRLMLAEDKDESFRGFFNFLTMKTDGLELPEARGRNCIGAHYGWLFTFGSDLQINLLHPFSKQQIFLPPILSLPNKEGYIKRFKPQIFFDRYVNRIAISASPLKGKKLNDECVIVAICGELTKLGFARLGDTIWTDIQVPRSCYEDVVYYKGKFYAVDCYGALVVCDVDDKNDPKAVAAAPPLSTTLDFTQKYLVESLGNLLLVSRTRECRFVVDGCVYNWYDNDDDMVDEEDGKDNNVDNDSHKVLYYTTSFSTFMLDESRSKHNNYDYKWKQVTTIGDRALFLGKNVSTSKAASNNIKANCIYFTDENYEVYEHPIGFGRDTGIFNIEDGIVQLDYVGKSRHEFCPPLWYI